MMKTIENRPDYFISVTSLNNLAILKMYIDFDHAIYKNILHFIVRGVSLQIFSAIEI